MTKTGTLLALIDNFADGAANLTGADVDDALGSMTLDEFRDRLDRAHLAVERLHQVARALDDRNALLRAFVVPR